MAKSLPPRKFCDFFPLLVGFLSADAIQNLSEVSVRGRAYVDTLSYIFWRAFPSLTLTAPGNGTFAPGWDSKGFVSLIVTGFTILRGEEFAGILCGYGRKSGCRAEGQILEWSSRAAWLAFHCKLPAPN